MKARLELPLGNRKLIIEGEGADTAIIKGMSFWSTLPSKCGACSSDNIGLSHRQTKKGDDYYGLKCNVCTADLTFHQRKIGGFYITADDTWSVWDGGSTQEKTEAPRQDDDIPF